MLIPDDDFTSKVRAQVYDKIIEEIKRQAENYWGREDYINFIEMLKEREE